MRGYEILEHIGDAKIRVFGKTKQELFLNAMKGMTVLLNAKCKMQNAKLSRTIKISSSDIDSLLVDFLSEVNYLAQTEREVYDGAKFSSFSDTSLEAELSGQKVREFGEEIKAVTHHRLQMRQTKDGWEAEIIFDI